MLGAKVSARPNLHYQPTVLMNCTEVIDLMTKEIFAPALPIRVLDNLDESLALANNSEYGLTSA